MLFTSATFLLFHLAVVALRWVLPRWLVAPLLLVSSYVFYLSWGPAYGLLMGGMTGVGWAVALGMERGTPFALAHTFRQTGPFRPNNVDKRVPGLVFVGSSTVPGVGVPMVLVSGKLAAERVERYARETAVVRW